MAWNNIQHGHTWLPNRSELVRLFFFGSQMINKNNFVVIRVSRRAMVPALKTLKRRNLEIRFVMHLKILQKVFRTLSWVLEILYACLSSNNNEFHLTGEIYASTKGNPSHIRVFRFFFYAWSYRELIAFRSRSISSERLVNRFCQNGYASGKHENQS